MMSQPMLQKADTKSERKEAIVIKKYANRRLYNTETSTYVTLEDLAQMVRGDKDFVVYDAKSGDDLTHSVLTQIIVEQESRQGGQTLLPIPFLRQLIRFYDDSIGTMVPGYLQLSLENLVKEQEKFRATLAGALSNPAAAFELYQDQARKNMEMFEQAMSMWTSGFPQAGDGQGQGDPQASAAGASANAGGPVAAKSATELDELKAQLSAVQARLDKLSNND